MLHPLTVASKVEPQSEEAQIVALLHDVVEDTSVTMDEIAAKFGKTIGDAVEHLTRRDGESYERFIERVCENKLAVIVKIADMEHNCDRSRLSPEELIEYGSLIERYEKWLPVLRERYKKSWQISSEAIM